MSLTPSTFPIIPLVKKKSVMALLEKGKRLDGRSLNEYRPLSIELGYIPKAEGSALVRLGNTVVLVGIKTGIGSPFPDTPDEGILLVNAEFLPLASPSFEPGPPDENATELARVVDRSLREIRAVDLSKLAIIPGKKVWEIWVDIYVLDHDGNLLDASMLAAMAALSSAKMPEAVVEGEEVKLNREKLKDPVPVKHRVVIVTVGKIDGYLIVDPTLEEESLLDARLAIAVSDDGRIVGMQKMGMGTFTADEVRKAIEMAMESSKMLHQELGKALKGKVK